MIKKRSLVAAHPRSFPCRITTPPHWRFSCLTVIVCASLSWGAPVGGQHEDDQEDHRDPPSLEFRPPTSFRRRPRNWYPRRTTATTSNPSASSSHPSISNLTCTFVTQPLNHHAIPRTTDPSLTYQQRYCYTNQYVDPDGVTTAPVLFYTGNESPLEEYVNHTGLMWQLAATLGAQIVFAEHRYEGQSRPEAGIPSCMAYATTVQVLADFASLIQQIVWTTLPYPGNVAADEEQHQEINNNDNASIKEHYPRPVIVFGGSYGGMLSAWMRTIYPQWVAGAISASAPLWGFPTSYQRQRRSQRVSKNKQQHQQQQQQQTNTAQTKSSREVSEEWIPGMPTLDGAYRVVQHGLQQAYPPTSTSTAPNHCAQNLKLAFPLIYVIASPGNDHHRGELHHEESSLGLEYLTRTFRLCEPLQKVDHLLRWVQTPWFDMAEGSFPYPSSYIPFALTHNDALQLPPWPVQTACWKSSRLAQDDFGFALVSRHDDDDHPVRYDIVFSPERDDESVGSDDDNTNWTIHVDWDTTSTDVPVEEWVAESSVTRLLENVRDAVAVWYNMSNTETCFDVTRSAPNLGQTRPSPNDRGSDEPLTDVSAADVSAGTAAQSVRRLERKEKPSGLRHGVTEMTSSWSDWSSLCERAIQKGSWEALCCNEDINLIVTFASGLGQDIFWPPSLPSEAASSYADAVPYLFPTDDHPDVSCADPDGSLGYPDKPDPWSQWIDLIYGNDRLLTSSYSNIIFSNGLLDPWSAAGVFLPMDSKVAMDGDWESSTFNTRIPSGLTVQKLGPSMLALLLHAGGHHSDLMFDDPHDPPAFAAAREIERELILQWIDEFWSARSR